MNVLLLYNRWRGKPVFHVKRWYAPPSIVVILCLLLFSSCSFASNPSPVTPTPTPTIDIGGQLPSPTAQSLADLQRTQQLVTTTPHPLRDLYSLAQRLKFHSSTPIPHVGRTTPLNEQVGQEDTFWVSNQDTNRYRRIKAKLVYVTPHVYMYVEDGKTVNAGAIQASATLFENSTYPIDRANFGSEWSPGIDADVHLTILNATGLGQNIGGYFSAEDEYPTQVVPYSNQREMFYVNLENTIPGSPDYNSTLAHEFQHMIHWYQHPVDLSWTNEGMSVLAQHLNGFSAGGLDTAFVRSPDTQLNDWSGDTGSDYAHYGAGYLFMDYFAEHYGGYTVLKELLSDPASPPLNFDHVLAKHGYQDRFMDVMHKWFLANGIEDAHIDQGQYGYPSILLPAVTPQHSISSYPIAESDSVHQNAAQYYDLQPGRSRGVLHLQLRGDPLVRVIGNDPYHSTQEWWSNRYDNMDSTLTHSFDLTALKGKHATLQFAAWFDLEQDYDYTFVEVSTDGTTWTTLRGKYTTASNPNGGNWGNGYTGVSTNIPGGKTPQWVQEQIDLTPYAGKHIQVRFEEVTDDAVNQQGFALDAIRIPELHFSDPVLSDNGWTSNGFIRSNNVLPEQYTIQAVIYQGQTFTTQSMQVDLTSGQGTLNIAGFGDKVTRVLLVISATAAETTLLAHYQLQATLS